MAHALQDRFSKMVLAKLRQELVLKDGVVCNNDYDGDPKSGAVKIPTRDTEVVAATYNTVSGLAATGGTTTYTTVTIDKDMAVNEIVDGYEASAVPDGMAAERLDSAAYSLAAKIDADCGTEILASATAKTLAAVATAATAYGYVVDARTELSKANVPNDGKRFLLATPDFLALLLKSDEFIHASALGDNTLQQGIIGKIAGFNVIEWNDDTANLAFVVGHPKFITRVNEWKVPVHLQNLSESGVYIGASAVQGRMVYAHKVLRAAAVIKYSNPAA